MADDTLRIGIIGCGGISTQHIRGYQSCDNVEVVAGADADLQRAVDVAGVEHAYTSFHDMLAHERLDVVSICTPPKLHRDAACAALEAGVHVLCEKPLAMDAEKAREMVDTAKKNRKLLVTAFCHRFHEPVANARDLIRHGKIGKVTLMRNRFGAKQDMTEVWFSNPDISGGGTLMDTAVHSVDLFRYLVGNPTKVAAALATADHRYAVEDCSAILLQTLDGAMGVLEASWTSPGSANVIEIYGTDGALVVDYTQSNVRFVQGFGEWEEIESTGLDRFLLQAQHFVKCVRGQIEPIVDGMDGLRAAQILDAAYAFGKGDDCGWARLP